MMLARAKLLTDCCVLLSADERNMSVIFATHFESNAIHIHSHFALVKKQSVYVVMLVIGYANMLQSFERCN